MNSQIAALEARLTEIDVQASAHRANDVTCAGYACPEMAALIREYDEVEEQIVNPVERVA